MVTDIVNDKRSELTTTNLELTTTRTTITTKTTRPLATVSPLDVVTKHSGTGTMCNMTMNAVDLEILKQREIIPRT